LIRVSRVTAAQAFRAYVAHRPEWLKGWKQQGEMYVAAEQAFGQGQGVDRFKDVYVALKSWKIARRGVVRDPKWVWNRLVCINPALAHQGLSRVRSSDWELIVDAVDSMKDVKTGKKPSLMAMSKFLHFFNPRLFVICDREVVDEFVFGHQWLRKLRDEAGVRAFDQDGIVIPEWMRSYMSLLALAAEVLCTNPGIMRAFADWVTRISGTESHPREVASFEATAIERFLIGLAELPPARIEAE
jgi:hypothetical protein